MKGGGMKQLLKQAQQMQKKMAEAQSGLSELEAEATVGGGMVTAKMNGNRELISLVIEPDAVDPDDVEMLQDLVIAAVNEAGRKMEKEIQDKMSAVIPPGMMGGGGIPGLM